MNNHDERLVKPEILALVLSKMLDKAIIHADYQLKELQGGTVGDVRLVTGMVETFDGENLPYKVVWKTRKNLSVTVIQIDGEGNTTSVHRISKRFSSIRSVVRSVITLK